MSKHQKGIKRQLREWRMEAHELEYFMREIWRNFQSFEKWSPRRDQQYELSLRDASIRQRAFKGLVQQVQLR